MGTAFSVASGPHCAARGLILRSGGRDLLLALLASFCGMLQQLTRILLGRPRRGRKDNGRPLDGVPGMALLLGALLVFSVWLPGPLLDLLYQAAGIIEGKP